MEVGRMLDRKQYQQLKKEVEPIEKLALHDDADGITSGVLLSFVLKIKKVWAPLDFGEWPIKPRKIDGEMFYPPDACVDMVPANPQWPGKLCIDHHPGHPPEGQRAYKLIWGEVPTSLIIYNLFRDYIPKEHRWKVVCGIVGDGQPELIPPEVFKETPQLLENYVTVYEKYGKIELRKFPIYLKLSAPLNAACKIPDKWYTAYSVLRNATDPIDILEDPALDAARKFVDDEYRRILKESNAIQLNNGIRLWKIQSDYKLERTLAFVAEQRDRITTVVVNVKTGRGSIRGTLAQAVFQHLQSKGFIASGHPGYGGLRLKPDQTFRDLYLALRDLKFV